MGLRESIPASASLASRARRSLSPRRRSAVSHAASRRRWRLSSGETPILVVTAGDAKIDNAKYRALFHAKAKMLTPEETSELIGHAPGGVCPFAVNDGVKICLDVSLKRFDEVFPACGSGNSAIGLTIPSLRSTRDTRSGWTSASYQNSNNLSGEH